MPNSPTGSKRFERSMSPASVLFNDATHLLDNFNLFYFKNVLKTMDAGQTVAHPKNETYIVEIGKIIR